MSGFYFTGIVLTQSSEALWVRLPHNLFSPLDRLQGFTLAFQFRDDHPRVEWMLSSINPNNISSITFIVLECRFEDGFNEKWVGIDGALCGLRLKKRRVSGEGLDLNIHFESERVARKVSKCEGFMHRFRGAGGVVKVEKKSMTMDDAMDLL